MLWTHKIKNLNAIKRSRIQQHVAYTATLSLPLGNKMRDTVLGEYGLC